VFFLCLVVHLQLFLGSGLLEGGVEVFLFNGGMDTQLHFDLLQQLRAFLEGALAGGTDLFQKLFDDLVVGFQKFNGVHFLSSSSVGRYPRIWTVSVRGCSDFLLNWQRLKSD